MSSDRDPAGFLPRLSADRLRHIVTLKMLHLYGDQVQVVPLEDASGWALMTLLPTQISDFDRHTYPTTELVVLIDGSSIKNKIELLQGLPDAPLVVKTYDEPIKLYLRSQFQAEPALSFISFTATGAPPQVSTPIEVIESTTPDDEATRLFSYNGYEPAELARYFADGARWFGIREGGRLISVCLVYRNFETVWEIAGVYTEPDRRAQGHARNVVRAALAHLLASGLIPRYVVRFDNTASIRVAEAVALKEFLRVDHYLVRGNRHLAT